MNISEKVDCIRYLASGRIVRLISTIERVGRPTQFVVELGFYSKETINEDDVDLDSIEFGEERIVDTIFENPPIEAISLQIEKLYQRKRVLINQVDELKNLESDIRRQLESLKKYDQLTRIEDFLAGKITYYCKLDIYRVPIVVRIEDERCGDDVRDRALKLLCLFGNSDRSLEWKINRYSDGSGSWSEVWPFCSKEEAEVKAREILAESFTNFRKEYPNVNSNLARRLVKTAKDLGMQIPDGFENDMLQHELAEAIKLSKSKQEESKNADAIVANIIDKLNIYENPEFLKEPS